MYSFDIVIMLDFAGCTSDGVGLLVLIFSSFIFSTLFIEDILGFRCVSGRHFKVSLVWLLHVYF